MTKTLTDKLYHLTQYYSFQMQEGTLIKPQFDEYTSILINLENVGSKIKDEHATIKLLCSLPPSYRHFRDALLYGKDSVSLSDVKIALLSKIIIDEEIIGDKNDNLAEGLVPKGRSKERCSSSNKSRPKSKYRNLICNYCRKKRHIKVNCYKLKIQKKGKQSPPKQVLLNMNQHMKFFR